MRSLIRFHVIRHNRLVAESSRPLQQRSRQQARCQHTQGRLDLSQELREALLVRAVCRVRLGPELLGIAVVELGLLLLSATVARSLAWLVVVASRWSSSCITCSWFACLVSSVANLTVLH